MTGEVKLSVSLLEKISVKHDAGEIVCEFHVLYGSENGRELFEHRRQLRAAAVVHRHTELMILVLTDTHYDAPTSTSVEHRHTELMILYIVLTDTHCDAPTSTSEGGRTIAKWHRYSFYNEISLFHHLPFPERLGANVPGYYNEQTTQP